MKNRFNLLLILLCVSFSGCINFNPNKAKESEEAVSDPKDDAVMANSSHLKFKGVPIDGTLKEFTSRMKRKGFKSLSSEDGYEVLEGDFAASKECIVYVSTLDDQDLVSRITVEFPKAETWESLYGHYKYLKELLTEKYGQPTTVTEKFDGYSEPENDNYRIHCVQMDRCKYETRFETEKGNIIMWIDHDHDDRTACFVVLQYKDKINNGIIKEAAKDDL